MGPTESRCYVLRRQRSHDHGEHVWLALTVLVPDDSADAIGTLAQAFAAAGVAA